MYPSKTSCGDLTAFGPAGLCIIGLASLESCFDFKGVPLLGYNKTEFKMINLQKHDSFCSFFE